jgi:hypothetical protein
MSLVNKLRNLFRFNVNLQRNKRANPLFKPNLQVNIKAIIETVDSQEADIQNPEIINKTSFSVNRKKHTRRKNNPAMSYGRALRAMSPVLFSTLILGSLALSAGTVNPSYFFAGALLMTAGIAITVYGAYKLAQRKNKEQENIIQNALHLQHQRQSHEQPVIFFQSEKEHNLALSLKEETPSAEVQNPSSPERLSAELGRNGSGRS